MENLQIALLFFPFFRCSLYKVETLVISHVGLQNINIDLDIVNKGCVFFLYYYYFIDIIIITQSTLIIYPTEDNLAPNVGHY